MALKEEIERSGNVLFRWRSYPPLLFFSVVVWKMRNFTYSGGHPTEMHWELACLVPVVAGLALRMWAIGTAAPKTSGGNRRSQQADELNTTGPYSIVRHPLYLGAFLVWTGVAMFPRSLETLVIVWLLFWVYYERIMVAEESFLERSFGVRYAEWANRTPAFFPRIRSYVAPRYPFSMVMALRREYSAWLAAATPLFVLKIYGDSIVAGRLVFNRAWVVGYVSVIVLATVVRAIKHHTRLFKDR